MTATPKQLFDRACELGLRLEPKGDKLSVMPSCKCPADFADVLRQNKSELLKWLTNPPCPGWKSVPPIGLPLNPVRPALSRNDSRLVMDFVTRQVTGTCPLCEWACRREMVYWVAFKWDDQTCALAAAVDVATHQLKRALPDVLTTLAAFDETATAVQTEHKETTEPE